MQFTTTIRAMGRNDARLIRRDSFLIGMLAYVLVSGVLLRFAVPFLAESLLRDQHFDLTPYYPLMLGYLCVMGAVLAGTVIGFIVLDERDDQTIKAMLVTPMPVNFYLGYRILFPALLAFIIVIADVLIVNLVAISPTQLVLLALVCALVAPVITLFFASFAANKVEGFALLKIVGTTAIITIAAYFIPEPLQFLAGVYPPYWVSKAFWLIGAGESSWAIYLAIGVITTLAALWLMIRRFNKVIYKDN